MDFIKFSNNDIIKVIRNLDMNKANGHDDITVQVITICDSAIVKPFTDL